MRSSAIVLALAVLACVGEPSAPDASAAVADAASPTPIAPACPGGHVILFSPGARDAVLIGAAPLLARAPTSTIVLRAGPLAEDLPVGRGGFTGVVDPETDDLYWSVGMEIGRMRASGEHVWVTHIPEVDYEVGLSLALDLTARHLLVRYADVMPQLFVVAIEDGATTELTSPRAGRAIAILPDGRVVREVIPRPGLTPTEWMIAGPSGDEMHLPTHASSEEILAVDCDHIYTRVTAMSWQTVFARSLDGTDAWSARAQWVGPMWVFGPEGLTFFGAQVGAPFVRITRDGMVHGASVPELGGVRLDSSDRWLVRAADGSVIARVGDTIIRLSPELVATRLTGTLALDSFLPIVMMDGALVVQSCGLELGSPGTVHVLEPSHRRERSAFPSPFGRCAAYAASASAFYAVDFQGDRSVQRLLTP